MLAEWSVKWMHKFVLDVNGNSNETKTWEADEKDG